MNDCWHGPKSITDDGALEAFVVTMVEESPWVLEGESLLEQHYVCRLVHQRLGEAEDMCHRCVDDSLALGVHTTA
jgi:hypothetical protein